MKSKIYTKTGDDGTTALVSGNRISKGDLQIDLYGEVDELNSILGIIVSSFEGKKYSADIVIFLTIIQSRLFDLGSQLACEKENREKYKLPKIMIADIEKMESQMDRMDSILPKLKNFILPGGDITASYLHLARTVCRRVERKLISFYNTTSDRPKLSSEFINRLSDYLFVLSRFVNFSEEKTEIEWIPKA
jgi:cob(I)alamin adenosyltransferase